MAESIYCVMACFDAETEKRLADLQNTLYAEGFTGVHTKELPQHITLGTFPLESAKEGDTAALVHSAARSCAPFPVSFSHIGLFSDGTVLFVAPDADEKLLALKAHFGACFGWAPHTTMLIDDPGRVTQALPTLLKGFEPFEGRVESLMLCAFWPTRHILSLPLSHQP